MLIGTIAGPIPLRGSSERTSNPHTAAVTPAAIATARTRGSRPQSLTVRLNARGGKPPGRRK